MKSNTPYPLPLVDSPKLFGLNTRVSLLGFLVDIVRGMTRVEYALELLADDGTVIKQYRGLYQFGDKDSDSIHAVSGLTPEQLPIATQVAGDDKFTAWVAQMAPALVPAISAEINELLHPTTEEPTEQPEA